MHKEPIISWSNIAPAPGMEVLIRKRIAALDRYHPNITGCRVVVSAPNRRRHSAGGVDVRIHLELPGPDLDVARDVRHGSRSADALVAMNAAFNAPEDRLKVQSHKMGRQEVKHHPDVLHGEIVEIEPELGWGFVRADDGREVYFQSDAMPAVDWNRLAAGDRLRFREMEGDKGPFAVDLAAI